MEDLGLFAIGDPSFDRSRHPSLDRLPAAAHEAETISRFYGRSLVLTEGEATKARFLESAGSFDVVHFASHAEAIDTDPMASRLILAADPHSGDSGTLFAHELYEQSFEQTRLVVLAACRTAAGRISRGEGTMSLARPFLARGVPAVIASLWNVSDEGSAELLIRFHRELASGVAPRTALRNAQLALLSHSDESFRAPKTWAPFQLIGGSTATSEQRKEGS